MKVNKVSILSRRKRGDPMAFEKFAESVDKDLMSIFTAMQGRLRFGDATDGYSGENVSGEFQLITDSGNADTEFAVTHTLGIAPVGYLVLNINKGGVVYDSGTAWTSTTAYFKCSIANTAITMFLVR